MDKQERVVNTKEGKSFTLYNNGNRPIPLVIPNVMNPAFSANLSGGVDLEIGQKPLFRNEGKKYVFFVVDESIKNGDKIDVPQMLEKRKKELCL